MASHQAEFRRDIRGAVRGLWVGVLDIDQFYQAMRLSIDVRLRQAWAEGAEKCGIRMDELSPEEQMALEITIGNQMTHINDFGQAIIVGSKANKGKLTPLFQRAEMWINQWNSVVSQAQTMACGDKKLKWRLGATEEHCSTCPALDGKVKRASYWLKYGIQPQNAPNPAIECGGWKCLCYFEVTDEPQSKGPLPTYRGGR